MVSQKIRDKLLQTKTDKKSPSTTSFADLFEATLKKAHSLRRNQEVVGTVVSISPQEVLLDIGAKSEGIVVGRELTAVADIVSKLSVGDKVDATVIFPESDAGQVVLSLRKLSGERRWVDLEEKKDNDKDIEVVALEVNRGGVICDYMGIRGFLPASQLISHSSNSGQAALSKLTDLIGKNLSARVIEVDRSTNRLILSQKSPDKKDLTEVLRLLSKVTIGETVKGLISAVLPFGIFVEIDLKESKSPFEKTQGKERVKESEEKPEISRTKLEGLVHVSEISWDKIDDPVKMFNVGDMVEVMVIAKDETSGRLNLSLKQLQKDPFAEISKRYTKDQEVSGSVAKITPYGVFITLEDNLDGLIHISKIPPEVSFEVGQTVSCTVDGVDNKSRRIALVPVSKAKPILYR